MKTTHLIMALAVLAMTQYVPAAVAGDPQSAPAAGFQDAGRAAEYIEAIRHAPDPSTAVAAYANAIAADRDSLAPAEAYVHRMIELGAPGMAYAQALDLSQREPGNGLAWGVLADVDARRGQFVAALTDIVAAVRHARDDPFVQQTAAQLLAWYDTTADQSQLPADLKHSLGLMRKELDKVKGFADIYSRAKDVYRQMNEEQKQAGGVSPSSGTEAAAQPPVVLTDDNGNNPPPVVVGPPDTTYIYEPYPYYESSIDYYPFTYGYPFYPGYPCYAGSFWWGTGPCFIGGSGSFYRHYGFRGFDHGRFFGHGFHGAPAVVDRGFRGSVGPWAGGRGFHNGGFGVSPMATGRFTTSPAFTSPGFAGTSRSFGRSGVSSVGHSFSTPAGTTFGGTHSFGHSFSAPRGTFGGGHSFGSGGRSFGGGGHSFGGSPAFGGSHSFGGSGGGFHSFGGGSHFGGGGFSRGGGGFGGHGGGGGGHGR